MKTKKNMIDKFEIEELESRFEMGRWHNFGELKLGGKYEKVGASVVMDISKK